ncbi:MAG: hypothetical protein LQ350_006318 [Teloschistes chrysophthalmus]|nr:MAG: hypothetical protein LQ350_006318 [Niorma chrysophthalma]
MDPNAARAAWKANLKNIPIESRKPCRDLMVWEHLHLSTDALSVQQENAARHAHHMSADAFKSDIDEIAAFSRLRSALCELDDLLGIAAMLRAQSKDKITKAYPTYLETHINEALKRVVSATKDLHSTSQYINKTLGDAAGATEQEVKGIANFAILLVDKMPEEAEGQDWWMSFDRDDYIHVWEFTEALWDATGKWKPDADGEWDRLCCQLREIWKVAAEKEPFLRAYLG